MPIKLEMSSDLDAHENAFSVDLFCKINRGYPLPSCLGGEGRFLHVLPVSALFLGLLQLPPTVPHTCIWDELAHLNCP